MAVPSLVLHDDLNVLKEGLEIFLMLDFLREDGKNHVVRDRILVPGLLQEGSYMILMAHCSPLIFCSSTLTMNGSSGASYPQLVSLYQSCGFGYGRPASWMIRVVRRVACASSSVAWRVSSAMTASLLGPRTTFEPIQYW